MPFTRPQLEAVTAWIMAEAAVAALVEITEEKRILRAEANRTKINAASARAAAEEAAHILAEEDEDMRESTSQALASLDSQAMQAEVVAAAASERATVAIERATAIEAIAQLTRDKAREKAKQIKAHLVKTALKENTVIDLFTKRQEAEAVKVRAKIGVLEAAKSILVNLSQADKLEEEERGNRWSQLVNEAFETQLGFLQLEVEMLPTVMLVVVEKRPVPDDDATSEEGTVDTLFAPPGTPRQSSAKMLIGPPPISPASPLIKANVAKGKVFPVCSIRLFDDDTGVIVLEEAPRIIIDSDAHARPPTKYAKQEDHVIAYGAVVEILRAAIAGEFLVDAPNLLNLASSLFLEQAAYEDLKNYIKNVTKGIKELVMERDTRKLLTAEMRNLVELTARITSPAQAAPVEGKQQTEKVLGGAGMWVGQKLEPIPQPSSGQFEDLISELSRATSFFGLNMEALKKALKEAERLFLELGTAHIASKLIKLYQAGEGTVMRKERVEGLSSEKPAKPGDREKKAMLNLKLLNHLIGFKVLSKELPEDKQRELAIEYIAKFRAIIHESHPTANKALTTSFNDSIEYFFEAPGHKTSSLDEEHVEDFLRTMAQLHLKNIVINNVSKYFNDLFDFVYNSKTPPRQSRVDFGKLFELGAKLFVILFDAFRHFYDLEEKQRAALFDGFIGYILLPISEGGQGWGDYSQAKVQGGKDRIKKEMCSKIRLQGNFYAFNPSIDEEGMGPEHLMTPLSLVSASRLAS